MTRPIFRALALALAASAVSGGVAAAHCGTQQRFTLRFLSLDGHEKPARVTATGPIRDHGIEVQRERPGGVYLVTLYLRRGTVALRATDTSHTRRWDPTSCRGTGAGHGTFTVSGGTGDYRGVHGHGTYTDQIAVVGARDAAGRCLGPESGVEPRRRADTVRMVGTVNR